MKYPRMLCFISIFLFLGMSVIVFYPINVTAEEEEWTASFEAFKPADDPKYHQRHTGGIQWGLFQEQPNEDTKTGKPNFADVYWIQGEKSWFNRLKAVEGKSALSYKDPANLADEKYHTPCPLCKKPTYFWLDAGYIDGETVKFINADFPSWKKGDGVCRNCFDCYAIRSGKWYDGKMASTTDIYTIGFNKSKGVLDYFDQVK